jgi:RNA polymerase sigma-70 factor (ECF subfamily)
MAMQFEDFDSDYLERLRAGDFSTQQHFVAYFGELIRLKAGRRVRSVAAVEDIRQETLARVLRLLTEQGIRQPERLGAFVNSVCNNVLHEHHRSETRELPADDEVVNAIPDPNMSVLDVVARRQLQQKVQQTLEALPEKDRCILKAVFLEERSKDEVCRDFGVTRDYLRVLVHRAKQSFKSHYLRAMQKKPGRVCTVQVGSLHVHRQTHRTGVHEKYAYEVIEGAITVRKQG